MCIKVGKWNKAFIYFINLIFRHQWWNRLNKKPFINNAFHVPCRVRNALSSSRKYHWVVINKYFALLTTSYGDIFPFIQIFTSIVCYYSLMDDRHRNAYSYVVVKVISFSFITGTMIWKLCVTYFGHLDGWDYFLFAFMRDKQIRTKNIAWSFKTEELKGENCNLLHDMRLSKRCWRKLESSETQHCVNLYIGTNVRKRLLFPSSG